MSTGFEDNDGLLEEYLARAGARAAGEASPRGRLWREGREVGEWTVAGFIGRGGSAEVYCARHRRLGTAAVLKVLWHDGDGPRERFRRETRFLMESGGGPFPAFYGAGEEDGRPWMAMELLEEYPAPSTDAGVAAYLLDVANAVESLHRRGWVHRDLKPRNILRRPDGRAVLADFGLLKKIGATPAAEMVSERVSPSVVDGREVGVGTPGYAAPEQFAGGAATPATDVHALGVLADGCFGGNPPREWERIIRRATGSIPRLRYGSVADMARAIRRRHWRRNCAWAALAGGALVVAAFAWWRGAGVPDAPAAPDVRDIVPMGTSAAPDTQDLASIALPDDAPSAAPEADAQDSFLVEHAATLARLRALGAPNAVPPQGWSPDDGEPSGETADPETESEPIAPSTYKIVFNANGGLGHMPDQTVICHNALELLSPRAFTRYKYRFAGWSTTPTGPVEHMDLEIIGDLADSGGKITLYAVWEYNPLGEGIDQVDLVWTTDANHPWYFLSNETVNAKQYFPYDKTDMVKSSGAGNAAADSWLQTVVAGPSILGFRYAKRHYSSTFTVQVDGETVFADIEGTSNKDGVVGWIHKSFQLGEGTHTVRFNYHHPGIGWASGGNGIRLDSMTVKYLSDWQPSDPIQHAIEHWESERREKWERSMRFH